MLRLVSDESFDGSILRGLYRRCPEVDIVRVQDVELSAASDPDILAWAAAENRILLTHDRDTIPFFAYERVRRRHETCREELRRMGRQLLCRTRIRQNPVLVHGGHFQ